MAGKTEYELIVSEGKRALWQRIFAALCFTTLMYYLYLLCCLLWQLGICPETEKLLPGFVKGIGFLLSGGIAFSVTKTVLIDTDKDKLISRFVVGPFFRDVMSKVPELEYVSVFLDAKEYYQVNLWYNKNKHYKMFVFEEKPQAFQFAGQVADKLKIDVLDATEKGDSKWIEKTNA
ncbi:MAG TPA: hypothetical protein VK528_06325 [Flavobacterium sp.]|nr:hypothetical protein [Flavobacterium sp.]